MKFLFVIPFLMATLSYAQQGLIHHHCKNVFEAAMTQGGRAQDKALSVIPNLEQDSHHPAWHDGAKALHEFWERVLMGCPNMHGDHNMSMGQQHHD